MGTNNGNASRAMAYLRKRGYHCDSCEQYRSRPQGIAQAGKFAGGFKRDMFKIFDFMAIHPERSGMTGVQVTTKASITPHLGKYRKEEFKNGVMIRDIITDYLAAGNRLLLFGYSKNGRFWVPTIVEVRRELLIPRLAWKSFVITEI